MNLDLYNGEEYKYEFSKLYLNKRPKDELEKHHNKEMTLTAETIRAKREWQAGTELNGMVPALLEILVKLTTQFQKWWTMSRRPLISRHTDHRWAAPLNSLSNKELAVNLIRAIGIHCPMPLKSPVYSPVFKSLNSLF